MVYLLDVLEPVKGIRIHKIWWIRIRIQVNKISKKISKEL